MMFEWNNRRGIDSLDRVFWASDHDYVLYHQERPRETQVIYPSEVLAHTDEEIKPIVKVLLEHKVPTTPSQLGMRPTDKQIDSMWNAIKRDEHRIKTIGLKLTNTETGEQVSWFEKDYKLNVTKKDFIWSLVEHQLGYLGFVMKKLEAEHIVNTLSSKMPPETKITIWKEIAPNVCVVGIENMSAFQDHTWDYIGKLTNHYLQNHRHSNHLLNPRGEVV